VQFPNHTECMTTSNYNYLLDHNTFPIREVARYVSAYSTYNAACFKHDVIPHAQKRGALQRFYATIQLHEEPSIPRRSYRVSYSTSYVSAALLHASKPKDSPHVAASHSTVQVYCAELVTLSCISFYMHGISAQRQCDYWLEQNAFRPNQLHDPVTSTVIFYASLGPITKYCTALSCIGLMRAG
jgi:hypothetical protein